ncbi:MAG: hypothetical protein R6U63_00395 [Longimicrobiales bacterium]
METTDKAHVHPHGTSTEPGPPKEAAAADSMTETDADAPVQDHPAAGADVKEGLEGHHLLDLWSDREEVHALPEILRPAEGLVAVGSGTVVKSARLAQSNWLVVLTDRRLLCIKGRAAVTRKVIDMPVSQVRGVEAKGLFRKTLSLDTGYGTLRISGLKKGFAQEMAEGLTALMGAYAEGGGEKPTAIRKADLSKAGAAGGHSHEALHELEETVGKLEETVGALTERVAFLEELVRSNVAERSDEAEVG